MKNEVRKTWTAKEELEARLEKYSEEKRAKIKVIAETKNYIVIKATDECVYLSVIKGRTENDFLPDIYIQQDYKGLCKKAQINWSACGSQDIEMVQEFIENLQEATEVVKMIDGKQF